MSRTQPLKIAAELAAAIAARFGLYALLLFFLLQTLEGVVRYDFLALTAMIVILMHEASHILGMEIVKADHYESFHMLAINYGAVNLSGYRAAFAVILPYLVLFPLGYWLTTTGVATYIAAGWAVILMHAILLPIEALSLRISE